MPLLYEPTPGTVDDHESSDNGKEWLVVSPYLNHPHLLDLATITEPQRLLAKALTVMVPIRLDYATAPYQASFNWSEVIQRLRDLIARTGLFWNHATFYIVVFRSQQLVSTDRTHLGALDERSHAEAMKSGGLLKYWFGVPDENYRNLATCQYFEPLERSLGVHG